VQCRSGVFGMSAVGFRVYISGVNQISEVRAD